MMVNSKSFRRGVAITALRWQNPIMETLDLVKLIEDRCRRLKLTESQLSQAVVGHGSLVSDLRRNRSPSVKRLERICDVLGLEFYVGIPREGPSWGPLAISADLPQRIQERLEKLAAEYEDWPDARRQDFMERFVDTMAGLLGPWPYGDEHASPPPPLRREATTELLQQVHRGASAGASSEDSAWDAATEAQREQAEKRHAAVERSNALAREGTPRLEADRTAAAEAGVTPGAVGDWRRKVKDLPEYEHRIALLDRKPTGRPSAFDGPMEETLNEIFLQNPNHLTGEHVRNILIERHGKAPALSTIQHRLKRERDKFARRPALPADQLPADVAALLGREPATAAHTADDHEGLRPAIAAAETILDALGLALSPDEKARLVITIRDVLYKERGDAGAEAATGSTHGVA